MAFCTRCGHKNLDEAAFCEECGTLLRKAEERPTEASTGTRASSPSSPSPRATHPSRPLPMKAIFIGVTVLAVLAVVAGVSMYVSGNNLLIGKWRGVPPMTSVEFEFTPDTMRDLNGEVKVRYEILEKDIVVYPEGKTEGVTFRVVNRNTVRYLGLLEIERVNALSPAFENRNQNRKLSAQPVDDPWVRGLAEHLTTSGAKLYAAYWCPHCIEQKELFGGAAARLPYVECSPRGPNAPQAAECIAKNIRGYPTWVINGVPYTGTQSLDALAQASNYNR